MSCTLRRDNKGCRKGSGEGGSCTGRRGFLCWKGSRKGFQRYFLGRRGGVLCMKGGFYILPVNILCLHISAGFILRTMQKAVATFVGSVHRVSPYWDLEADARR